MKAGHDQTLEGLLHHHLIEHFLERGHAPALDVLATRMRLSEDETSAALRGLEQQHGVVLHAAPAAKEGSHRPEIWLVHPFSSTPTLFWVSGETGGWWAPCIWCALGIAGLAGGEATVSTRLGGETETVDIEVRGGQLLAAGLVAHFCVPIARAWDDVHRFCSTALVFRSVADVHAWCERHGRRVGSVQPLDRVWAVARAWYGGHRAREWRKHTQAEAKAIFTGAGLTDAFWSLEEGSERF